MQESKKPCDLPLDGLVFDPWYLCRVTTHHEKREREREREREKKERGYGFQKATSLKVLSLNLKTQGVHRDSLIGFSDFGLTWA